MKLSSGQSLLEILLAIGLSVLVLPTLFLGFMAARQGKAQSNQRLVAVPLMIEAEEAVRSARERGWTEFAAYQHDVPYHPEINNGHWILSSGNETINDFQRQLVLSSVFRDTNGTIVTSGGTLDPSTIKAIITVSWDHPLSSSVNTTIYLTRRNNQTYTETTEVQFEQGTKTSVVVTNNGGGEVTLGSTGGYGDWCNPYLSMSSLDLPKSGVANAISAIEGQIATGTGENASGVSYANILLDDPAYPIEVTAAISGTFDGYKTNDVFIEQDCAYLGTDNNNKEVVIIDLTQKDVDDKYQEIGYYNLPGNRDGNTISVANNTGYVTDGDKLYSFDLSIKSGSRPSKDSDGITLPNNATEIIIIGNYAYITINDNNNQLVIVDVSNPNNLIILDQISVAGAEGKGLFINRTATRAYLVTGSSENQREFFIISIDQESSEYRQTLSSYDTNGMDPKGVITVSGPRAIVVGVGAEEYQVINITHENLSLPDLLPQCGGMEINSGINGISTVFTTSERAYSYIITGDQTSELKIVEGGPGAGGGAYSLSGVFESQTFDVTSVSSEPQVAFNRLFTDINEPALVTEIKMQVAIADPVAGSCDSVNFDFVGPDKTDQSYFTSTGTSIIENQIPFDNDNVGYENPGRCLRYKAFLSTQDETLTPILNEVVINFSP